MDDFSGAGTYRIDKNTLYFAKERDDITFDYKILKLTNDCLILKRHESESVYKKIKDNEPSAEIRELGYAERILGIWSETGDLSEKRPDGIPNLISGFNEDGSYRFCHSNSKRFYTVQEDLIRMVFSENFDGNYSGQNISYAQILEVTDRTLKLRYFDDSMGTVNLIRVE